MAAMKYVGLDIHRKSVVATVMDPSGTVVERATLGGQGDRPESIIASNPEQPRRPFHS